MSRYSASLVSLETRLAGDATPEAAIAIVTSTLDMDPTPDFACSSWLRESRGLR